MKQTYYSGPRDNRKTANTSQRYRGSRTSIYTTNIHTIRGVKHVVMTFISQSREERVLTFDFQDS